MTPPTLRDDESDRPANGPRPPSTTTVTASQNGMIRARAAARQTIDIPIHISP